MRPASTLPQRSRASAPPASACSDVALHHLCPHPTLWAHPRSHQSIMSEEDSMNARAAARRRSPEEDDAAAKLIELMPVDCAPAILAGVHPDRRADIFRGLRPAARVRLRARLPEPMREALDH